MSRCAGQTWGGQRFLSFLLMGGMLDRHPRLRVATLAVATAGCPTGSCAHAQIDYVRGPCHRR